MNKFLALAIVLYTFLTTLPVRAEVNINGFGSVVAGRVTEGDSFLADYPKTGVYDKDWSASPDSSLGLQLSAYLSDDFSIVVQAERPSPSASGPGIGSAGAPRSSAAPRRKARFTGPSSSWRV